MALVLKHATLAQLGQAFRERNRNATREECARLAKWLIARVADGTLEHDLAVAAQHQRDAGVHASMGRAPA